MIKKHKYESCFAELIVKPLVSEAKDKCLALASLVEVQQFLPSIDTHTNLDLMPVAFNACVVNRVNKNRDVIDTQTALAMYKQFINKPINVEHNRTKVIGVIVSAGFSEFGSDRLLTEEQVSGMKSPFNIVLGGIIWRVVAPELSDHIEEASDPTSTKYLSVSASWELGFTDYRVALFEAGDKNLTQAKKIISDPAEVESVKDSLTSLGGDGKVQDLFAYRMPSYEVLPLGIGFTEKPAAEVKGIATNKTPELGVKNNEAFDDKGPKGTPVPQSVPVPKPGEAEKVGIVIPKAFEKEAHGEGAAAQENQNKISQSAKTDVKTERNIIMKITSIKDLTDENMKECTASAISQFISDELTKGSAQWEKEKNSLNTQLAEAQTNAQKIQADHLKLQEQMKQVQATIDTLNTEKAEREKVEKFNVRMASINEEYELDDEVRAALVEDIKAIASDEEFTKWQTKAKVLLKGFAKKKMPPKDDNDKDKDKDGDCKGKKSKADDEDAQAAAAKAAAEAQAAIDKAIDNGDKSKGGLPNGSAANPQSLKEKYAAAFAKENFEIK